MKKTKKRKSSGKDYSIAHIKVVKPNPDQPQYVKVEVRDITPPKTGNDYSIAQVKMLPPKSLTDLDE